MKSSRRAKQEQGPPQPTLGSRHAIALSNRTFAEALAARLRGAAIRELHLLDPGRDEEVYARAAARRGEHVVEAVARGRTLEHTLEQLMLAIDQATAPEET